LASWCAHVVGVVLRTQDYVAVLSLCDVSFNSRLIIKWDITFKFEKNIDLDSTLITQVLIADKKKISGSA